MKFDFKSIPKFCINLKRNEARRITVQEEFKRVGIDDVVMWDAVDKHDIMVPELSAKKKFTEAAGVLGCALSHLSLIKFAKESGFDAICIFEDDVEFCDDFWERIAYIENQNGLDFDIFTLGGHFANRNLREVDAVPTEWKHIMQVKQHGGTYAMIIAKAAYDFILRNWTYNFGADEFYANHVYRHFRSYAFVPFLVTCRPCVSDITDQYWEYENINWYYQRRLNLNALPPIIAPDERRYMMDTTFIIPVRIESKDREFNFLRVIQYLCNNFDTNIIIAEHDIDSKVLQLLKYIDRRGCTIEHTMELSTVEAFHRTRLLNEMISKVRTEVTVNYDIDVILPVEAYFYAKDRIIRDGYDLVYPFDRGTEQLQVRFPDKENYKGENLMDPKYCSTWGSLCGHVQFFKTESYRDGGMENENFISYGAEDRERMERFLRLGYKVDWSPFKVYHLEHARGKDSSVQNPWFHHNEALYCQLRDSEVDEIKEYYRHAEYLKKYGISAENLFANLR